MQFGPLSHFWTLRFESKHSYFKDISRATKNLKNITYTLAKRHQVFQSIIMSTSDLGKENTLPVQGEMIKIGELSPEMTPFILKITGECDEVYVSMSVHLNGVRYDSGACVILNVVERMCQFGLIKLCFFHNCECYFIIHEMDTECFDRNCHAYVVVESNRKVIIQSRSFLDHNALPMYKVGTKSYVVMKYKLHQEYAGL